MASLDEMLANRRKAAVPAPVAAPATSVAPAQSAGGSSLDAMLAARKGGATAAVKAPTGDIGNRTPLGYLGRAFEAPGILPWALWKNIGDDTPDTALGRVAQGLRFGANFLPGVSGISMVLDPASRKTAEQTRRFIGGDEKALPLAKEVLFTDKFRENHPNIAGVGGYIAEAATNPLNYLGFGAAGKVAQKAIAAPMLPASVGEIGVQLHKASTGEGIDPLNAVFAGITVAAPILRKTGAAEAIKKGLRPFIRLGKPTAQDEFLRQAHGSVTTAGEDAAKKALSLGEGLSPEMEREARRLLERPADPAARAALERATGGKAITMVDLARQRAAEAARAGVPEPRVFRPTNPAEGKLNQVMERAQKALAWMKGERDAVPAPRVFRPINPAEGTLNRVMERAQEALAWMKEQATAPAPRTFRPVNTAEGKLSAVMQKAQETLETLKGQRDSAPAPRTFRPVDTAGRALDEGRRTVEDVAERFIKGTALNWIDEYGVEDAIELARETVAKQASGEGKRYHETLLAYLLHRAGFGPKPAIPFDIAESITRSQSGFKRLDLDALRQKATDRPMDRLRRVGEQNRLANPQGALPRIAASPSLKRSIPDVQDIAADAARAEGTNLDDLVRDAAETPAQRLKRLGGQGRDGVLPRLATPPSLKPVLPDSRDIAERAARAEGTNLDDLFRDASENAGDRLRRVGERNRMANVAGVTEGPLPRLATPPSLKPAVPSAHDIAVRAAHAEGVNLGDVLRDAAETPLQRLNRLAERARLARVAGVAETPSTLRRPESIVPSGVDDGDVARYLIGRGAPTEAAFAAADGRNLTESIAREAAEAGLPLPARTGYFPRVPKPPGVVDSLLQRLTGGLRGAKDPHRFERDPRFADLGIDEIEDMRKAGRVMPAFREDFAIPLAVRNQRASESLMAHKQIKEGFARFGAPVAGRSPQQLADEGLVMVKYDPRNSDTPFSFAASAMPDDPQNWSAVPRDLVNGLQAFHKTFLQDEGLATLGSIWKSLHGLWKGSVTVIRPAFYVNNAKGGMVNNLLADANDPEAWTDAFKATVARRSGTIQTPNGDIPYEDALRLMREQGVMQSGLTRSLFKADRLADVTGDKGVGRWLIDKAAKVEEFNRAVMFFDRLRKGASAEEAARDTIAAHFDYSNAGTTASEKVVREFVPFWLWLKNNAEFQVTKFLEKPQVYLGYARAREAMSDEGRGERQGYQKYAAPTGIKTEKGEVVYRENTPIDDLLNLVEEPTDTLFGSVTPFLKETAQQVVNRDFRTGRQIKEFEGQVADFGPAKLPARLPRLIRSFGGAPAQAIEAGLNLGAGSGSAKDVAKLGRLFVPGVLVSDEEKARQEKYYRAQEALAKMRAEARQKSRIRAGK